MRGIQGGETTAGEREGLLLAAVFAAWLRFPVLGFLAKSTSYRTVTWKCAKPAFLLLIPHVFNWLLSSNRRLLRSNHPMGDVSQRQPDAEGSLHVVPDS
jgi:hypothetical protein